MPSTPPTDRDPSAAANLHPPRPKFALEGSSGSSNSGVSDSSDSERGSPSHSRAGSALQGESPPITPQSLTFSTAQRDSQRTANPFSPPGSVISFDLTPHYPLHTSASRSSLSASRSTSIADFTRITSSAFGSRPGTADYSPGQPVNYYPQAYPHHQHHPSQASYGPRPMSARSREAFTSPPQRPTTMNSVAPTTKVHRERGKSNLLSETQPLEKPWLREKDPYMRVAYYLTYTVMLLGVAAGALKCFFSWRNVPFLKDDRLCVVLNENFDGGDDTVFGPNGSFFREVDMSGFGNGEFEMTTASSNNSFVRNGHLYILPTLTSDNIGEAAIFDGYVYNITGCTYNITHGETYLPAQTNGYNVNHTSSVGLDADFNSKAYYKACSAVSNSTLGTIVNPIQSARLTTRKSASIKYGRVEVRAKIPRGDWLWPAIWMLPVDNTYGSWPASGEIDIMESRGNGPRYPHQGVDWIRGSLNWGPTTFLNGVAKTFGAWHLRRGTFDTEFHTYALEWTENFIRIYVDTRLQFLFPVLSLKQSFWQRGQFPPVIQNGSQTVILNNPWINGTKAAPFDQPFYLILDVAVGGTSGWFPDNVGKKPWLDGSQRAMSDFWNARHEWLSTWPTSIEDRAMVIDSVKMWQRC